MRKVLQNAEIYVIMFPVIRFPKLSGVILTAPGFAELTFLRRLWTHLTHEIKLYVHS